MTSPLTKSVFHNIGVIFVAFLVAYIGKALDLLLHIGSFASTASILTGGMLLAAGFLLRVWATFHFYRHNMKVILLAPQQTLITTGPFAFSRNPLYLGGNLLMFLGASFIIGSPMAIALTLVHLPLMDLFIRREERQLDAKFGDEWRSYKGKVRRWI